MGTILVVDDEPLVRTLLKRVLADSGFSVIEASSGPGGHGDRPRPEWQDSLSGSVAFRQKPFSRSSLLAALLTVIPEAVNL